MQHVEVKPTYGITEDEMAQMLRDSLEHGYEDMKKKMLAEAALEADRLIRAITSAITMDGAQLNPAELQALQNQMEILRGQIKDGDRHKIKAETDALEKLFMPFAQWRLGHAVQVQLTGQDVGNVSILGPKPAA
jgi:molecular chaperone HscA